MAQKLATNLNTTKDREVIVPCSKCAGKTAHEIVVSSDETGSDDYNSIHWSEYYQIIRCKGCKFTSFRKETSNSEDYIQVGQDEWEYATDEELYPSRLEGRKDLGDGERFLPSDTRRVYKETLQALVNNSPVLAGIGLRALVETICKERNAAGGNLLAKIDDLATQNVLTPVSAKILHKIRTLGNAAAHEVKPHSERQLGLAMDVVEHLLKDVYILPKLTEDEFDD